MPDATNFKKKDPWKAKENKAPVHIPCPQRAVACGHAAARASWKALSFHSAVLAAWEELHAQPLMLTSP